MHAISMQIKAVWKNVRLIFVHKKSPDQTDRALQIWVYRRLNACAFLRQIQLIFCGLFYDVQPIHDDRFLWPCGYGSHVCFFFFLPMVETFFSCRVVICNVFGNAKIVYFLEFQILSTKIVKKSSCPKKAR
jgi:hypothetical protein